MKHTPGPWRIEERGHVLTPLICSGWRHIARICDEPGENGANARLIAAAPSLLEWSKDALQALLEYRKYGEEMRGIGRGFHPTGMAGHSIDGIIGGIANAITRATGNSPDES